MQFTYAEAVNVVKGLQAKMLDKKAEAAGLRQAFGDAVRRKRQAMGISQRAMAKQSGLNQRLLSAVESAGNNMTIQTMVRLAAAVDGDVPTMLTAQHCD